MIPLIRFAGKAKDLSRYLDEQSKRIGPMPTEKQLDEIHRGLNEATIHQRRDLIQIDIVVGGTH